MRISFDMDGTLVGCDPSLLTERRVAWFLRPWFDEPLRQGCLALIRELIRRGCDVWIYTTSDRSPRYLRGWLHLLGVYLGGVVNRAAHGRAVGDGRGFAPRAPSKYPPAFGIDLHLDDL